jgi:hypothetical protein
MSQPNNNYPYYANILTPAQLGMTPGSSLNNIEDGVAGLVNYINLLVEGTSPASLTGGPLGNQYFLQTNQNCVNTDGSTVTRSLYIDNVPSGGLGIIPDGGMGQNFSSFQGLLPGALEDILSLSQIDFMSAFSSIGLPKCQSVTIKTIDINNNVGYGTGYVALDDLNDVPPCSFQNLYNPVTQTACSEGFKANSDSDSESGGYNNGRKKKKNKKNKNKKIKLNGNNSNNNSKDKPIRMPDDIFLKIFIYSMGALLIYVVLKLLANMYKKRS